MYNFDQYIDSNFIDNIKRIMKEKWKSIEDKTKYGWITAYYQCENLKIDNEEVLENLATKIGDENCEQAIREIKKLSRNLHPKEIPMIAESILNEIYTITLLRKKNSRKDTWKVMKHKQCLKKSPTIFTICN
ncbi:uncharacterized protein, partial [Chelonus insularis]|uniref:uncharacterized protein n=1 Tax=Chelonus insularis TaxID=460826 RepID=UPI00158C0B8D